MSRGGSALSLVCTSVCTSLILLLSLKVAPALNARGPQGDTKTAAAETTSATPVLIELFTSEGCSSCPPADIFLQKLDTAQPIPGAQLIVLSEHVTYWDQDGWKDPNSSPSLTDRQSSYEGALGEKTVFTPQLIVDGTQQIRLGNPQQIKDLLQKAAATPKVPIRIGEVTVDAGNPTTLRARLETDANFEKHNADVYVAIALDHVESQVLRGENGGRHLVHVAVVQELTKVGKLQKGKTFIHDVQLKLKPGTDVKNVRLVALVQESGPGKVLGAALRKPAN
jgi:hypothetical protein